MNFFKTIAIVLYMAAFVIIGGALITLALNIISPGEISDVATYLASSHDHRLGAGITGAVLIFVGILTAQLMIGKMRREKTIAFDNPDGQVTISLTAIEDFVRKVALNIPEVKELRSDVVASKKGIDILCRAVLFSDVNIPEITERVQATIKTRVQDMLGVEEPVIVKIHIAKITHKGPAEAHPKEDKASRYIPFGRVE